jgi:hypothetical protein
LFIHAGASAPSPRHDIIPRLLAYDSFVAVGIPSCFRGAFSVKVDRATLKGFELLERVASDLDPRRLGSIEMAMDSYIFKSSSGSILPPDASLGDEKLLSAALGLLRLSTGQIEGAKTISELSLDSEVRRKTYHLVRDIGEQRVFFVLIPCRRFTLACTLDIPVLSQTCRILLAAYALALSSSRLVPSLTGRTSNAASLESLVTRLRRVPSRLRPSMILVSGLGEEGASSSTAFLWRNASLSTLF